MNVFDTLTLKQIFWKTKTFFKKLEYHFLVEYTENASFPYKAAMPEANLKTNRIVTTKCTNNHNEWSFASIYFFLKLLFQFKNHQELFWCTRDPNFTLIPFVSAGILFGGVFFPVSILNSCERSLSNLIMVSSMKIYFDHSL